jgi:hypothetical protein
VPIHRCSNLPQQVQEQSLGFGLKMAAYDDSADAASRA